MKHKDARVSSKMVNGLNYCTLSLVSEYLKDLAECMDDGDSRVAKEAKLFDALEHKSVGIEVDNQKIAIFTKAPLRSFGEPFMRYSLPCKVDRQGAWDAELDLTNSANYVMEKVLENMGFVHVSLSDYGRKMVNDVNVEIHGVKFKADFVVLDYVNEGEPSILFGRDFLATTKSQVNFGLGEIRMNLTKFEEGIDVIDLLEEVGSSSEEVFKMGKANRNKGYNINKLTPPPSLTLEEIPPTSTIPPQPIYHPLTPKQKEKMKEVLDIKYKELEESKPILEVLENYVMYKKKLNEILIGKERLNKKEFSEEDKVGIIEHGLPKKMCDPKNYVLSVKINGVDEMVALVDTGASEYEPTIAEEKQDRRNEMKARGTLLIALPNKDQLKFHSYKDAKLLMKAIEKRLQKLITQLEIQGEVITQEDINLKLLRSLPSEWKTHALIWRNKQEIETISLDELYNNLKIYEPEISGSSSTSQNPPNVAFVSSNSNSSTNEADNTAYEVTSQPNSPQLAQEDLEQIDPDDLEEMDLQWEMAMLTIRARRFIKRTGRKLDVNGQRVGFDRTKVECYNCHKYGHFARECKAPRNQENRGREINRRTVTVETPTKNALVAQDGIGGYDWSYQAEEEHPINFALMAHTSSGSSSSSDSEVDSCSKSCVKAYATLKEQYDSLSLDYKRSQFNLVSYKAGLESVEARLAHYKKNEVVYEESINVLNLEVKLRDNALVGNKKKLEKTEKERDELKLTLEKFQNSSKSLNNFLESQVIDKFKTGLGYNAATSTAASPAVESFLNSSEMLENQEYNKSKSDKGYHVVPPPFIGNFIPRKPDLTFMDEIVETENMDVTTVVTPSNVKTVESNLESAGVKSNGDAVEPKPVRKNSFRPPVIEDWNFDDESEVEIIPKVKTVSPSTEKIKFVKSAREIVEKVETSKQNKHYPRGNQRNWNNLMSQRLGSDFKMINKACFVCGSFEHLHYVCDKKVIRPVWNNSSRVNHKNFANKMTHPHPNRRFVPQAVLTRSGKINTAGASVNTAVRPVNTAGSKPTVNHPRPISNAYKKGYSQVTRPFNKYSEYKNSIFNKKVNTVRVKDTTARDRAVVSENKGKGVNVVKASACWVWKAKNSSASNTFKKYSYIDAQGIFKSIMAWIPQKSLILLFYVQGNPQQK
ncbi:ribonuclease H-like domain-containing protein [Tanacetum coccineum]|uniref:Ribonuclease H-like domain-containing protein n=1 Tax=Tanacetum coccineum TaxID=301880 RepID=A0ABQ5C4E3_9ASTR